MSEKGKKYLLLFTSHLPFFFIQSDFGTCEVFIYTLIKDDIYDNFRICWQSSKQSTNILEFLALNSELSDFEDALQYFTALGNKIEFIITRNVRDYKNPKIIVQTPQQYIEGLSK